MNEIIEILKSVQEDINMLSKKIDDNINDLKTDMIILRTETELLRTDIKDYISSDILK